MKQRVGGNREVRILDPNGLGMKTEEAFWKIHEGPPLLTALGVSNGNILYLRDIDI